MFKVKYNNEKAVTCYNGEIPALEILRNYVQNSYKISVYRDTIIVATKDKKIVAIAGMEGLLDILEPFDTVYVFKKDEITFDYNNKELMENFINNNDINIIDPENIGNSIIKINRTTDTIINNPTPVQETLETQVVEAPVQIESEPTTNTVNVVTTTPISSVEPKKKSKAPLIIIIILLLVGLGVVAYFLIPKITNGGKTNNNSSNNATKKEEKLKSNEAYYYDVSDVLKKTGIPKEQKILLVFNKYLHYKDYVFENDNLDIKKGEDIALVGIQNNSDYYTNNKYYYDRNSSWSKEEYSDNDNYLFVDIDVKDGVLEIPKEVDGHTVRVIGMEGEGVKTRNIFRYYYLDDNIVSLVPKITKIIIPDTVIQINMDVFSYSFLKELDIPDSVKVIESLAFAYNPNLTKVILPKNLYILGRNTFKDCQNLESLKSRGNKMDYDIAVDANNLFELDENSFDNCPKLKSIAIYNNTDYINIGEHKSIYIEKIYAEGEIQGLNNLIKNNSKIKNIILEDTEFNHNLIEKYYVNDIPKNCKVEYIKIEK